MYVCKKTEGKEGLSLQVSLRPSSRIFVLQKNEIKKKFYFTTTCDHFVPSVPSHSCKSKINVRLRAIYFKKALKKYQSHGFEVDRAGRRRSSLIDSKKINKVGRGSSSGLIYSFIYFLFFFFCKFETACSQFPLLQADTFARNLTRGAINQVCTRARKYITFSMRRARARSRFFLACTSTLHSLFSKNRSFYYHYEYGVSRSYVNAPRDFRYSKSLRNLRCLFLFIFFFLLLSQIKRSRDLLIIRKLPKWTDEMHDISSDRRNKYPVKSHQKRNTL